MLPHPNTLLLLSHVVVGFSSPPPTAQQRPLPVQFDEPPNGISVRLFASLERLARLVDIAYCVGTTGLSRPFECASRCKDFPTLDLVSTWNTGAMMSDSCGYVAIDHGTKLSPGTTLEADGTEGPATNSRNGAIIVAFRGTYSITNTVVDLSTVPQEYVPYPSPNDGGDKPPKEPEHKCESCTVHMGFLNSWKTARDAVLPTLKPLRSQYPKYSIQLVGHSLGGAVAALAALELKVILGWDNIVVTTFGEPRVGNMGFVRYLDEVFDLNNNYTQAQNRTYRRVTHVDDPVPLLPLADWGFKSHAGEIFVSKPDLSPSPEDIRLCVGDYDVKCIAGSESESLGMPSQVFTSMDIDEEANFWTRWTRKFWGIPSRLKLWQLLFAHRDYFWRLGLCVPGSDPIDWGRDRYPNVSFSDEL